MVTEDRVTPTALARERFRRLPPRATQALVRRGICSWSQVAQATDDELLALDKIGRQTLAAIREEQRFQRL